VGVSDKWGEEMRYIAVDDVANAIYHNFPSVRTMADARSVIEEAPTIDAVSVVHGEWVNARDGVSDHVKCTNCFRTYYLGIVENYNYCPNCGAKMKGADDE